MGGSNMNPVPPAQNNMFGGDLLGNSAPTTNTVASDPFGMTSMPAPMQPSFPSYIAYEDDIITIGFKFEKEGTNNHLITAHFKNNTAVPLNSISLQVAA